VRNPQVSPESIFDARGLYLKVMPNGGRYWRFNYRFNGKQKTLTLGNYPDVSLAKARESHHEARRQLAEGIDPGAVKQAVSRDFESVAQLATPPGRERALFSRVSPPLGVGIGSPTQEPRFGMSQ
jgi:hypothetical protein